MTCLMMAGCGAALALLVMWSPGLATMIMVLIAVGWLIRRWAPEADRVFIVRLYAVALAARFLIGAALHLWAMYQGKGYLMYGQESFDISGDSAYLSLRGWIIAQTWEGRFDRGALDQGMLEDRTTWWVYPYIWFHYLFGFSQFAVKLFNGLLGALLPLVAYATAKALGGLRSAKISAWLVALFPSTLLWSVTNLKETPTALGLAWVCWTVVRGLQRGVRPSSLLHGLGALGLIWTARPLLLMPVVASLAIGWGIALIVSRPTPVMIGIAALLVMGVLGGLPLSARTSPTQYWPKVVNRVMDELVSRQWGHQLSGGSAYRIYDDVVYPVNDVGRASTFRPRQIVGTLLMGWGYFLFSPVPWRVTSALQAVAMPEVCLWYVLVGCALLGTVHLLWRRCGAVMVLVVPLAVLTTMFAMSTGNMGVAFRHRGMFIPLYLTLSAVGLAAVWERRARHADPLHLV
ncbi:MAG: glycosyltransferase family 39 protein [Candidatus Omnitrophica bacterium]|nr:glycosyltransferase family 39 protein [Candidatus Omnitrophota bacterium]